MVPFRITYAWETSDCPGRITFATEPAADLAAAVIQAVRPVLPVEGAQLRALSPAAAAGTAIGGYALTGPEGRWFLRVTSHIGTPALEKALVDGLQAAGVPVNPILAAGIPLVWHGHELRLDIRPLVQARHFDGSDGDLVALGRAMAAAHRALADTVVAPSVHRLAATRNDRLLGHRDRLAGMMCEPGEFPRLGFPPGWAERNRDWLRRWCAEYRPDWHQQPGAQCLHGEIHQGNVLYDGAGTAMLVDFEESTDVFAPPVWDLAYAVQRFCLFDQPEREVFLVRLGHLTAGYGKPIDGLGDGMRQIAYHCMATLLDLFIERGLSSPESEFDKFVQLEGRAARLVRDAFLS
ncbi:phosphotransferase [Magnetospirillum sp. LM-5]|uniref:phosphotransferase n=1 Tax=Magnetospirillum sp. LM-5 TaxID=2681466 RepID=UPI0020C3C28C|nr:phosphotransferase [Magnetospirillum sp. LM-5]